MNDQKQSMDFPETECAIEPSDDITQDKGYLIFSFSPKKLITQAESNGQGKIVRCERSISHFSYLHAAELMQLEDGKASPITHKKDEIGFLALRDFSSITPNVSA
jgi:hypothetical protein